MTHRATLGVLLLGLGVAVGACGIGSPPTANLTHQDLQLRTVLGTTSRGCRAVVEDRNPSGIAPSARLPEPNATKSAPCLVLGPAILILPTVKSVVVGRSPAGQVFVSITLLPSEVGSLSHTVGLLAPAEQLAWVVLGQVLSLSTAAELNQPAALAGRIQVAGGLDPSDPRPRQLATVLSVPGNSVPFVAGGGA